MARQRDLGDPARDLPRLRHWGGFLLAGCTAFLVDWSVLELGVRLLGLPPLIARLFAVSVAMVTAWLAHRRLTFALTSSLSIAEFMRYAAAAWTTAALNYVCFAAVLLAWPSVSRLAALVFASIVATIFSYLSMRYGVFRRSGG
jgi:putative flippase GtrA